VVEAIYAQAQVLLSFPDVGYRYRQVEEGEIRILLYGHYRIAYLYRQDSESVDFLACSTALSILTCIFHEPIRHYRCLPCDDLPAH